MGERSAIDYFDLSDTDTDAFVTAFMAEKIAADKEQMYHFKSVRLESKEKCPVDMEEEIWFDWDDWKIHGYWYESFCKFLCILQKCGLRGEIRLTYTDGSMYFIYFDKDGVNAEIRGDYETHDITEKGIEYRGG